MVGRGDSESSVSHPHEQQHHEMCSRRSLLQTIAWAGAAGICSTMFSGCRREEGDRQPATSSVPIVFLVASSAAAICERLAAEFERETGMPVAVSSGPSNGLASQILRGAPGDLFLSASREWSDVVEQGGMAAESVPLLSNRLVLVVPQGNPAGVSAVTDLLKTEVRRVAMATENAPAGRYAAQALAAVGIDTALVENKKIVRGGDARMTLGFVARAEADAGIVYSTDAIGEPKVEVVAHLDESTYDPIVYPLLLLKRGQHSEAASRFYEFLQSARAAVLFKQAGFALLSGPL